MTDVKRLLEQASEHDARLMYCDKCGNRYYLDSVGDVHDRTAEECRSGLCLAPEDHHPFVEGPLPDYEQASVDRRNLIRVVLPAYEEAVDALSDLLRCYPDRSGPLWAGGRAALSRLRGEK